MTSVIELIKMLYSEGFFSSWKTSKDVKNKLVGSGFNFSDALIGMSLTNAVKANILSKRSSETRTEYSQRQPPEIKIKEEKITELNKILSGITEKKLGERFQQDIRELNTNFTYDCGNSATFLLRKILEKAIFYVFSTNNKLDSIKNKEDGSILGLDSMIHTCAREKIKGVPILLPKTARELSGIKFLGDSSAHDYLADIEVEDINHQLSIWTMAIKELSTNLS